MRLKNRNGTKSLKKLYNEFKIPIYDREELPVIADDMGVVWIMDIGVAHRCAVNSKTVMAVQIDCKKIS